MNFKKLIYFIIVTLFEKKSLKMNDLFLEIDQNLEIRLKSRNSSNFKVSNLEICL